MELWAQEDVDLVGPGFIEFGDDGLGRFGFIAADGSMDCPRGTAGRPPGFRVHVGRQRRL